MSIYNYEILNPVISPKRPFYDIKRKLLFFPANGSNYRYYIEVARNNKNTLVIENLMIIVEFVVLIIMADVKLI